MGIFQYHNTTITIGQSGQGQAGQNKQRVPVDGRPQWTASGRQRGIARITIQALGNIYMGLRYYIGRKPRTADIIAQHSA